MYVHGAMSCIVDKVTNDIISAVPTSAKCDSSPAVLLKAVGLAARIQKGFENTRQLPTVISAVLQATGE